MTREKAIQTIEVAIAEVEWEYPMDYAAAFEMAIEALLGLEVVRCRECKLWDADPDSYGKDDGPKGKCMKSFEKTFDDDFCSYGERKDGAE